MLEWNMCCIKRAIVTSHSRVSKLELCLEWWFILTHNRKYFGASVRNSDWTGCTISPLCWFEDVTMVSRTSIRRLSHSNKWSHGNSCDKEDSSLPKLRGFWINVNPSLIYIKFEIEGILHTEHRTVSCHQCFLVQLWSIRKDLVNGTGKCLSNPLSKIREWEFGKRIWFSLFMDFFPYFHSSFYSQKYMLWF